MASVVAVCGIWHIVHMYDYWICDVQLRQFVVHTYILDVTYYYVGYHW